MQCYIAQWHSGIKSSDQKSSAIFFVMDVGSLRAAWLAHAWAQTEKKLESSSVVIG